ncbi:MAG: hypothetical protein F6K11_37065 [Leptolyngbya sp. SIO3F4]|nr:hypothetical protein [Leptolyngbya sp. SIO3F4]
MAPEIGIVPFYTSEGVMLLDDDFTIPDDSWGYVWFRRQFTIRHKASGIESRWINGKTGPE